jgi:hypothetical protein
MRLSRALPAVYLTAIAVINAMVAAGLFQLEYSQDMASVEGSYMSLSRFLALHPKDHTWMAWWFTGMPMNNLYPPGFHTFVAGVSSVFHASIARSFHMVVACVYVLGAVSLFLLMRHLTRSWHCAFAAGLLYSVMSPSSWLVPDIARDTGSVLFPRRYQVLAHYGDGPHMAALAMIPLVLIALDLAVSTRHRWMPLVATLAISAVMLTNWPGTVELLLAVGAYALARLFASPSPRWPALFAVGLLAYLVASPWNPPSTLLAVSQHAQQSDNMSFDAGRVLGGLAILAALFGIRWALSLVNTPWPVAFFAMLFLLTGCMVFGYYWFAIKLSPQATRTHILMELSLVGLVTSALHAKFRNVRREVWVTALLLLSVGAFLLVPVQTAYAKRITKPIQIQTTDEYQVSEWLQEHAGEARVFVPGSISLWMNLFNNVPQLGGCCDPGVPTFEHRIALYTVYTDTHAGNRATYYSKLWLRAYGASQVVMVGPKSAEAYKPYQHPEKFEGVLPVLWRKGDNTVYRVSDDASLVHLLPEDAIVRTPPIHGLDVDQLARYVDRMDPAGYAHPSLAWTGTQSLTVQGLVPQGHVLSLQISWDPGWHASSSGPVTITSDALGLMTIHTRCDATCTIHLAYDDPWRTATRISCALGLLCLLAWVGFTRRGPSALLRPVE